MRVRSDVETLYKLPNNLQVGNHSWNIEHIREWGNSVRFKIVGRVNYAW